MAKLSSTLRNMLLSLTGICIIVSGILALVNKVTKAPIEEAQVKAKVEAISAVTPKFDNNPFAERLRRMFMDDLKECMPIRASDWMRRPLPRRLIESFLRLFSPLL